MNLIQHNAHYLFVVEDGVKKYLRFDFGIVPSKTLPSDVIIGEANNESYAIIYQRPIEFVEDKIHATILNNDNDFTKHVHGVYQSELEEFLLYLNAEPISSIE